MNKLTAIVNMWDGAELLPSLLHNTIPVVDSVVVVYSNYSNYGNVLVHDLPDHPKTSYVNWEPKRGRTPHNNEIAKRNFGLECAKQDNATHFLMMDVDEFYDQEHFVMEKERLYRSNLNGLVCGLKCYFKEPTLTIGMDKTWVPFIHKIIPSLSYEYSSKRYPFAYDHEGNARIDPTRRLNITKDVVWSEIIMHHYSWVRADIERKINNSAASKNLKKSSVLEDYNKAIPGYFCKFYGKELLECENKFDIALPTQINI